MREKEELFFLVPLNCTLDVFHLPPAMGGGITGGQP